MWITFEKLEIVRNTLMIIVKWWNMSKNFETFYQMTKKKLKNSIEWRKKVENFHQMTKKGWKNRRNWKRENENLKLKFKKENSQTKLERDGLSQNKLWAT